MHLWLLSNSSPFLYSCLFLSFTDFLKFYSFFILRNDHYMVQACTVSQSPRSKVPMLLSSLTGKSIPTLWGSSHPLPSSLSSHLVFIVLLSWHPLSTCIICSNHPHIFKYPFLKLCFPLDMTSKLFKDYTGCTTLQSRFPIWATWCLASLLHGKCCQKCVSVH